jgi:hypothetical protein
MTAEQDGVQTQELEPPCAARIVSQRTTELAREYDVPEEEVSEHPDVDRTDLNAYCDRCQGTATFTTGLTAFRCLSPKSGLRSCARSWVELHPEDYLDEDGGLQTPEVECTAESGKYVCMAQFLLARVEQGAITACPNSGICIVELEGRRFKHDGWGPMKQVRLDIGLMGLPEDENGEAIIRSSADAAAAEQTDAVPMGNNPLTSCHAELLGANNAAETEDEMSGASNPALQAGNDTIPSDE